MAGKSEQRRRNEDHGKRDEADMRLVRHQHIHCDRAEREIDDADHDLQQRQRPARQRHLPVAAADHARTTPHPDDIADQHEDHDGAEQPIEPGRQLIDRACRFRRVDDAEAQHGRVAEPEGQSGDEADLGDLDAPRPRVE